MKKVLSMLLYVTGFIQGQFTQALKQVFNVESMQFIDENDEGKTFLKLNDLLTHLRNSLGAEVQQMYMTLMFLNVVASKQLQSFFRNNYQGGKNPDGYSNIHLIIDFIDRYLLADGIKYKDSVLFEQLLEFRSLIKNIPMGKVKSLKNITCQHCTDGYLGEEQELECNVCKGTGLVKQWCYTGDEITDDYILELQDKLLKFAPIVAKIVEDYIQYYVVNFMYNDVFVISKSRTGNATFSYDGDSFTVPFYCDLKGSGKLPDDKIKVAFIYNGVEFTIPLLAVDESKVEKPETESKFIATDADVKATESIKIEESVTTTTEDGEVKSEDSQVKYTYKRKKDGGKVVGFNEPHDDWDKYYKGTASTATTLYFNANKYSRDAVRQAYANLVRLPKSVISIETIK